MPNKEAANPIGPDAIAEAERIKALGNVAYKEGKVSEALQLFSEAIEKNPNNAIYYANRAAARLAQKQCVCVHRVTLANAHYTI